MIGMHVMNISRLDLNLLPVFDALMRERNVTRAAHRLNLSQPAVSHALRRLRDALGDPLLVRSGRDMVPTPRAEDLLAAVRPLFEGLGEALHGPTFAARNLTQTFRLAMPDIAEFVVVPGLMRVLADEAPDVRLALQDLDIDQFQNQLAGGELDAAIIADVPLRPGMHQRRLVREERLVGLVRRTHPFARRAPTAAQLRKAGRLAVTLSGGRVVSPIELVPAITSQLGTVRVSTPHFAATAATLMHSDLVLIIGELAGETLANLFRLCVVKLPIPVPAVESSLVWHERLHRDPAQRWFREVIVRSLEPVARRFPVRDRARS
jgi:DNA-binding transcriptional LysR family regulator